MPAKPKYHAEVKPCSCKLLPVRHFKIVCGCKAGPTIEDGIIKQGDANLKAAEHNDKRFHGQ